MFFNKLIILTIFYVTFLSTLCATFDVFNDVSFNLYTRKNRFRFRKIAIDNSSTLLSSNFMFDKPLKIFIHGYTTISEAPIVVQAFLNWSDVNVITVDWTKGTQGTSVEATEYASEVGRRIAQFIDWLSTYNFLYENIHLIGVSLGCHVAGYAGRLCKNGKVEYITGCDPIGLDNWINRSDVINAKDGKYVEIIHTSAGIRGLEPLLGTSDFYPNGGKVMPGCKNDVEGHCSHARSINYFLDSIGNEYFVAKKCKNLDEIFVGNCSNIDTSYMGGCYPKNISGVYYLTTNAHRPYYKSVVIQ